MASSVHAATLTEQQSTTTPLKMWVGLPDNADPQARYPLVLWLHGFSLRGADLSLLKQYGPVAPWPVAAGPYILVAPQLPKSRWLWRDTELQQLVEEITARYPVDPQRRVLMGASLGAAGAWDLAARMPGAFSAVINAAGAGSVYDVQRARVRHARFFHGRDDRNVPLSKVQAAVDALSNLGADVELTVFDNVGHTPEVFASTVFANAAVYRWAFEQRALAVAGAPGAVLPSAPSNTAARVSTWIEALAAFEHRRPGTESGRRAEQWVEDRLRELGLQPQRDAIEIDVWQPQRTQLSVAGANVPASFMANSGFTAAAGEDAPLVYVGRGRATDVTRARVAGRIAVVDADLRASGGKYNSSRAHAVFDPDGHLGGAVWHAAFPSNILGGFIPGLAEDGEPDGFIAGVARRRDAYLNAQQAGAVGVIVLLPADACGMDPSAYWPYDGLPKTVPGLYVAGAAADAVRQAARAGATARMVLEGRVTRGVTHNVWAELPGASTDAVLVTSHHDAVHRGAVEDASGVAQVLAQASRWLQVPRESRPRSLVFVLAAGHFYRGQGAAEFARRHPDVMARTRGIVTVEHTPAREFRPTAAGAMVATGRPQHSTVLVPKEQAVIKSVTAALKAAPQPSLTLESPIGTIPFSDTAGYVAVLKEQGKRVPYASWISAPCYLITADDTLDKIDTPRIDAVIDTVSALVDAFMQPAP